MLWSHADITVVLELLCILYFLFSGIGDCIIKIQAFLEDLPNKELSLEELSNYKLSNIFGHQEHCVYLLFTMVNIRRCILTSARTTRGTRYLVFPPVNNLNLSYKEKKLYHNVPRIDHRFHNPWKIRSSLFQRLLSTKSKHSQTLKNTFLLYRKCHLGLFTYFKGCLHLKREKHNDVWLVFDSGLCLTCQRCYSK